MKSFSEEHFGQVLELTTVTGELESKVKTSKHTD